MNKKIKILWWSFYDFANTIFSMNIITLYFPLWVTVDKSGKDIHYALALATGTILTLIFMPLFGVISDEYKRRMPFLIFFTLICVTFTSLIGIFDNLTTGLLFFVVAYFSYQVSIVFYDALLPDIADKDDVGRISGYGVSLGYLGAILGLILVAPFVGKSRTNAFIPTSLFFLLFSLPCLIFIKDKQKNKIEWQEIHYKILKAVSKIVKTFKEAKNYKPIFLFLLANFFFSDAVNTTINFVGIYSQKVIGFSDAEKRIFFIVSTVFAIISSFLWGVVTDKFGAKKTMLTVLLVWIAGLIFSIISFTKSIFWICGGIIGSGLGGIWVTGRTLVVQLSNPEKLAEFFGLYGLTEKFTAVIGPILWGLIVDVFLKNFEILRYKIAVSTLLFSVIIGYIIMLKVPYKKNYGDILP